MHLAEYREVFSIGVPLNQSIYTPVIIQNGFKIDKSSLELCSPHRSGDFLFGAGPIGVGDRDASFLDVMFLTKDCGDLDLIFKVTAAL